MIIHIFSASFSFFFSQFIPIQAKQTAIPEIQHHFFDFFKLSVVLFIIVFIVVFFFVFFKSKSAHTIKNLINALFKQVDHFVQLH